MEKLAAHRRRIRAIRRRVVGAALATFLASSGVVLVQLVTGHDPALGRGTSTTTSDRATADATGSATGHRSPASERSSGQRSAARPSAVTTSAS
jgi:hypothetical protein